MKSPIRVLHLVASSRGGGAAHVRDLALGLDRARFAAHVAMPEDGGNVRRETFDAHGIPFHAVNIAEGFSPSALLNIRRLLRAVDVLHVHGARAALYGRWAASVLGDPRPRVIYTLHGFAAPHYPPPRRTALLAVERALAPLTDCVVAVCEAERDAFVRASLAPPERVRVARNGIDAAPFSAPDTNRVRQRIALGAPPDSILITTICRLHKPRDFDTLLRAFKRVVEKYPPAHLLVVGDGPLRPHIERDVAALALAGRVTLAGWRADLPSLYAATDIYALTTWGWEGLPLTVLEAMAAARPVAATRAGGIPEAVVEGETGLLVERRDANGMAAALTRLASDRGLRERMGNAGRARVQRQFTLAKMIADVERVYETVNG
jgi:glycosyltransferase involved in cell wall biosynthesis